MIACTRRAERAEAELDGGWRLACPACRLPLAFQAGTCDAALCPACGPYIRAGGVWHLLAAGREARYSAFLRDYTVVRHGEGRGSEDPAAYRRLPFAALGDAGSGVVWQWTVRARTFQTLCRRVLPALGSGLRVLDLGAGVGWLSNRLAALGHNPLSVELSLDGSDGLGAARHFDTSWPRLQAEFDRLPLAPGQADLAIFNASFHYSEDPRATLAEALRALRPDGAIVVMDSPIYISAASGRRMAEERHASFERNYGTRSDSLHSVEFLTWSGIAELGRLLDVRWTVVRPWYGLRWAMRPLAARLRRRREPSTFALLVGRRGGAA